jgi:hypothetical protein
MASPRPSSLVTVIASYDGGPERFRNCSGEFTLARDHADLARLGGVTRARLTPLIRPYDRLLATPTSSIYGFAA